MAMQTDLSRRLTEALAGCSHNTVDVVNVFRRVDLKDIGDEEVESVLEVLKKQIQEVDGPQLLLSLPDSWQSELLLNGCRLPGLDAEAKNRATPRQIFRRLLSSDENLFPEGYAFAAVGKDDWLYYLRNCSVPIESAREFLQRKSSDGGLSPEECDVLVRDNPAVLPYVDVECLSADTALQLILGDIGGPWRDRFDFAKFRKVHWEAWLEQGGLMDVPRACEKYLSNGDGSGFSDDELLRLSHLSPVVIKWLDPHRVPFEDAYRLYLDGHAQSLWDEFPFENLTKGDWELTLREGKIVLPPAFRFVVENKTFSVDELCEYARQNLNVIPFLPISEMTSLQFTNLQISVDSERLWNEFKPEWLDVDDLVRLARHFSKDEIRLPTAFLAEIANVPGLTEEVVQTLCDINIDFCSYLPCTLFTPDLAVKLWKAGRYAELSAYSFERWSEVNWLAVISNVRYPIPNAFEKAIKSGVVQLGVICRVAGQNDRVLDFIPTGRLTGEDWVVLVQSRKEMLPASFLEALEESSISPDEAERIVAVNALYCTHISLSVIEPSLATKVMGVPSGECLWMTYDFSRYDSGAMRELVMNLAIPSRINASAVDEIQKYLSSCSDGGLLEIGVKHSDTIFRFIPCKRLADMEMSSFESLCKTASEQKEVLSALVKRIDPSAQDDRLMLPHDKEVKLLKYFGSLREYFTWKDWPYVDVSEFLSNNMSYLTEYPRRIRLACWRFFHRK